jgi:hypothetical protein
MNTFATPTTASPSGPLLDEWLGFLTAYCNGWSQGDAEMIRSAVADDFVWDDPEAERVSKDGLGAFLPKFKERIDRLRNSSPRTSYLTLSDVVVDRNQPTMTVWCCFAVPGTDIHGTSQIRVGNDGVISEHRAYQKDPPVRIAGLRGW